MVQISRGANLKDHGMNGVAPAFLGFVMVMYIDSWQGNNVEDS
jgi:hypothetical protein